MNDWVGAEEELTKELCFRGTEMNKTIETLKRGGQTTRSITKEVRYEG